jgi:uncharacterized protein YbjT (DUF2867 family)
VNARPFLVGPAPLKAVVLGATGLVGRALVGELTRAGTRVVTAGRRPLGIESESAGIDFHPLDFEALCTSPDAAGSLFDGVSTVFIALGTTLRRAGSREAFRRVDLDYVQASALAARDGGVAHLLAVSSLGASATGSTFYLRVKGEAEEALTGMGFPALSLMRPALLLGARDEVRRGERVSAVLLRGLRPLLRGALQRYRPIPARVVARAMVRVSCDPPSGVAVFESHHLATLGH